MCSETSPRISFSSDLVQEEDGTSRRDTSLLLESNSDFEFSICSSVDHQSSSADDLFAGGMILPVLQIRERIAHPTQNSHIKPPLPCPVSPEQSSNKEIMVGNSDQLVEKTHSKSFWGFKRSSSFNCDIKKSLICSLSLLTRSNSTGSSMPNSKRSLLKDTHKQNSQKNEPNFLAKSLSSSASSSSASGYVYSLPHKPPLKKKTYVRISPVLNVPPPYISKGTANLFGLGSLLRNGKEKRCRN